MSYSLLHIHISEYFQNSINSIISSIKEICHHYTTLDLSSQHQKRLKMSLKMLTELNFLHETLFFWSRELKDISTQHLRRLSFCVFWIPFSIPQILKLLFLTFYIIYLLKLTY